MNRSRIEWTDYTWNPVTGCLHGCSYCYGPPLTRRFPKNFPQGFKPTFYTERLIEPLRLRKPAKIFTVSMGDLFGEWVPFDWQMLVLGVVDQCPIHTFQFLTKNPANMTAAIKRVWYSIPKNAWFGTTVTCNEDVRRAWDLPLTMDTTTFISFEPLLGPINAADIPFNLLDWAIIGARTNPTVRPENAWVEGLIKEADRHDVPVFLKDSIQKYWPEQRREYPKRKMKSCNFCEGTGIKRWKHRESKHHSSGSKTRCPVCGGTGQVPVDEGVACSWR